MANRGIPHRLQALISFAAMLICGMCMFVLTASLTEPFRQLVQALNSQSAVSWKTWMASLGFAAIYGGAWLFFFILFEVAKKRIVDAALSKDPDA